MGRHILIVLAGVAVAVIAGPVNAIPALPSYISEGFSGASYSAWSQQGVRVLSDGSVLIAGDRGANRTGAMPPASTVEGHMVIGVLRGVDGSVVINGVALADGHITMAHRSFAARDPSSGMDMESRSYSLGDATSEFRAVERYRPSGSAKSRSWGSASSLSINVDGFPMARFTAIGIDRYGVNQPAPRSPAATLTRQNSDVVKPERQSLALVGMGLLAAIPLLRRRRRG